MVKNTLTVGRIEEGFVLDHIQAGRSMDIYKYLHLDKLDCCVAIIKNAKSNKMGKKDIMKIECPIDFMDLDILGFIDHNITVNIIKNSAIVDKKALHLPHEIRNVIHCKNPRCITSIEQGLDHIFVLTAVNTVKKNTTEDVNNFFGTKKRTCQLTSSLFYTSKTISRVMSLDDHLSRPAVASGFKRPT